MRKPKWWDVPITWGDSCKASLIGAGIGLALNAAIFGIPYVKRKIEEKRLEEEERENLDYLD